MYKIGVAYKTNRKQLWEKVKYRIMKKYLTKRENK